MSDTTPTNPTSEKAAKLLQALRLGKSVAAASRSARIHRSTYYAWRKIDDAFAVEADDAIEAGTDALEDALMTRAKRDDTTAAIFLLKARRPAIYRETQRHELTGADGAPLVIQFAERSDGPQ